MSETTIYDFEVQTIDGKKQNLSQYRGKVLLIVNIASKCQFTSQYDGLEELYKKFKDKDFVILGFPCNQFAGQEPGDETEIKKFCSLTYQVSFPLFSKIDVNGDMAHPLYQFLKKEKKGFLGTEFIKWNFTKFLVDKEGRVCKRFAPKDKPEIIKSYINNLVNGTDLENGKEDICSLT